MPQIEIRRARAEDREAVMAFCAHTWEGGDYIHYVWDDWLSNPEGRLLVATAEEQPVGLAHDNFLNQNEVWLEGLRVDPDFRQHGIGARLHQALLIEAMAHGSSIARLLTESSNYSAIKIFEQSLMEHVGSFVPFRAQPLTTPSPRQGTIEAPTQATLDDLDEIIDYLDQSNTFPLTGGLYYKGFTAYTISDSLLKAKLEAGEVYVLRRWERLDGIALLEERQRHQGTKHLFIGYIDGTTESISLMAYALRQEAAARGLTFVSANIPDLMMIRDAFIGAEYQTDGKIFVTYERGLK
jgi:GNAT superfamily N-acetyltransferase